MSTLRRRIAGCYDKASDLEPNDELSRELHELAKQTWDEHQDITVLTRRPGGMLELHEIPNNVEAFYRELDVKCFDIGTPFPSYDPRLRCLFGDESLLDGSRINFIGEHQAFCGNVLFARQYGPDLGSLSSADVTFLCRLLHHPVRPREPGA